MKTINEFICENAGKLIATGNGIKVFRERFGVYRAWQPKPESQHNGRPTIYLTAAELAEEIKTGTLKRV